ncbi:hypothetical protein Syun_023529 [Stephania yunnanensis]|uniref:Uncharacterized protein n=1 Tax=Stephania yunnanensis TaxID=152371 RepID=A0AAP0HZP5_9MAGN
MDNHMWNENNLHKFRKPRPVAQNNADQTCTASRRYGVTACTVSVTACTVSVAACTVLVTACSVSVFVDQTADPRHTSSSRDLEESARCRCSVPAWKKSIQIERKIGNTKEVERSKREEKRSVDLAS